MSNATMEKLVWLLVYLGLLLLSLGIFMQARGAWLGWVAIGTGSLSASIGVLLVFVRSRRPD